MDGALSSSRYGGGGGGGSDDRRHHSHNNNQYHHRGGGGGRRGGGSGGGRGGGRNYYQSQDRGGGSYRHQPYNRNRGGGGGGGGGRHRHRGGGGVSGNRFGASDHRQQGGILQQLSAMLSRVGDVQVNNNNNNIKSDHRSDDSTITPTTGLKVEGENNMAVSEENADHQNETNESIVVTSSRPEVTMIAKNISDLTKVMANVKNLKMFFDYNRNEPSVRTDVDMNQSSNYYQDSTTNAANTNTVVMMIPAQEEAGILAHLLVSCVSTLVLQTPTYAALTLALHQASQPQQQQQLLLQQQQEVEFGGFAARCVTYAMRCFSRELDVLLLDRLPSKQQPQQQQQYQQKGDPFNHNVAITQVQRAKTVGRLKLLLRHFALLGRLNIVKPWQEQDQAPLSDVANLSNNNNNNENKLTVLGLFRILVSMATRLIATSNDSPTPKSTSAAAAAYILALLVISNVPYLIASGIPMPLITESLLQPLESILSVYWKASPYTPGFGSSAILLKDEPSDEAEEEDDDDDEEEENDEVKKDEGVNGRVCDSLQDMWRTVQNMIQQLPSDSESTAAAAAAAIAASTKFALLSDDPWNHVRLASEGFEGEDNQENETSQRILYTEDPLYLELSPDCRAIPFLLHGKSSSSSKDNATQFALRLTLDGIIFGRLPIFGSPPTPGDNDDGDDDDDDMEDATTSNNSNQLPEHLLVYRKEFNWNDRCLLAEAVRDCVLSYENTVSPSGIERGTAKDVAEQIWSLYQAWNNQGPSQKKGLEYAILETLLSLIVQSPVMDQGVVRHVYVSRVLLELTRLQPSFVPPALAVAVSNLVQDYMPALAPYARDNLCRWLAFHLVNTDYQWPAAYWRHWTTYVVDHNNNNFTPKSNSRSRFVQRTLAVMSSNVHDLQLLSQECLPSDCELKRYLLPHATNLNVNSTIDISISSLEQDLQERIWQRNEEPDLLCNFLICDEVSETVAAGLDHDTGDDWRRTWWRTSVIVRALLHPADKDHARLKGMLEPSRPEHREVGEGEGNEDDAAMEGGEERTNDNKNSGGDHDEDADVVAQLLEILPRYGPVILAALAKDAEGLAEQQNLRGSSDNSMTDRHLLDYGEACLLQVVHNDTYYSRTVLETVVECLLQHKLVNATAVLLWVLADYAGKDNDNDGVSFSVVERWWELASLAFRVNWANKLASQSNSDMVGDGIGMIVDSTGEEDDPLESSTSKLLLDELGPLLQYAVQRVQTLVSKQEGKTLTAFQIELVEGMKYLVLSSYALYYAHQQEQQQQQQQQQVDTDGNNSNANVTTSGISSNEPRSLAELLFTLSDVDGSKLASYCLQLGRTENASTKLLCSILERI